MMNRIYPWTVLYNLWVLTWCITVLLIAYNLGNAAFYGVLTGFAGFIIFRITDYLKYKSIEEQEKDGIEVLVVNPKNNIIKANAGEDISTGKACYIGTNGLVYEIKNNTNN